MSTKGKTDHLPWSWQDRHGMWKRQSADVVFLFNLQGNAISKTISMDEYRRIKRSTKAVDAIRTGAKS